MSRNLFLRILKSYNSIVSRHSILSLDLFLAVFSFTTACLIVFEFDLKSHYHAFIQGLLILTGIRILTFVYFSSYAVVIRFIGEKDLRQLLYAITTGSLIFFLVTYYWPEIFNEKRYKAIILIDFLLLLTLTGGMRVSLRLLFESLNRRKEKLPDMRKPTVIFGAGELGAMVERVLRNNNSHNYKVVAFCDDNPKLWNQQLNGIKIYSPEELFEDIIAQQQIRVAIIGINQLPDSRRVTFNNLFIEHGLEVLKMPAAEKWIAGELMVGDLRSIHLEDLLSRPAIQMDKGTIYNAFHDKVILVTGCAGSIGSEIVRQLLQFEPRQIIGIDQAESPLCEISLELENYPNFIPTLGNILDTDRMEDIFAIYKPEVIFHAAAYKHVPAMESFPAEGIKTNVHGTIELAQLASRHRVKKFVFISTDKAVNPTNVMGATKRLAEMHIQSIGASSSSKTRFITTRFGNVLGSNGSVIPIFKRQIGNREPLTVTHPEITRYFMTISEACQLVLEAGAHGIGGEIFVFDMGEPVRILDMAEKLIRLSGLTPYMDVPITFTGLRPGEKLHEELFLNTEDRIPTHHPLIMRANGYSNESIIDDHRLQELIQLAFQNVPGSSLVQLLCELVPDYEPIDHMDDDSIQSVEYNSDAFEEN